MQCNLRMTWCYVKTHANKQKSSSNCGERQSRIRDCESAGTRQSFCHDSKVKLGGEEIKIGSMFDAEGGSTTDCKKNRVRLAWNK